MRYQQQAPAAALVAVDSERRINHCSFSATATGPRASLFPTASLLVFTSPDSFGEDSALMEPRKKC
jgi:hypothetical protein